MTQNNTRPRFFTALLAGGILGAGVAILLAPQSGRKTRRDLRYLGKKAMNRSNAVGIDLSHSVHDLIDDVSDRVQEGAEWGRDWAEKVLRDTHGVLKNGMAQVQEGFDKVRRVS